jgi:hypothetical protein
MEYKFNLNFTFLLRSIKPHLKDHYVYEVIVGNPEDYNIELRYGKFSGQILEGDPSIAFISKEWITESYDNFVKENEKELDIVWNDMLSDKSVTWSE